MAAGLQAPGHDGVGPAGLEPGGLAPSAGGGRGTHRDGRSGPRYAGTVTSSSPRLPLLLVLALAGLWAGCGPQGTDPAPGNGGPGGDSGYGVPVQGFPSWQERALLVLTNAVRMAPLDWRTRYGADFSPSLAGASALDAYPPVSPVRWSPGLNRFGPGPLGGHGEDALLGPRFLRRDQPVGAGSAPPTRSPVPSGRTSPPGTPRPPTRATR